MEKLFRLLCLGLDDSNKDEFTDIMDVKNKEGDANYQQWAKYYQKKLKTETESYQILRDVDLFVLDNSIRESTVGQLRGHTKESKWNVFKEVKKCGFKNMIVASFSHMTRVDDVWVKDLIESGEDPDGLYAFSEITEGAKGGVPDSATVPIGMRKMKDLGMRNAILELDLGDVTYDFTKFSIDDMCALLKKRIEWCHDNLDKTVRTMVNFRDLAEVMPSHSERVFKVVDFLGKLPLPTRPFGLLYEELGNSLLEECATWSKFIRRIMTYNDWDGHLLFHVHEKFGYSEYYPLEMIKHGTNGIWASICSEGAAIGHASSCVTLLNLIRHGNKNVIKRYNCSYLRKAAINVTQITTGVDPHPKHPIYGERALDFVLGLQKDDFDLADFFEEKAPVRICSISSESMVHQRMIDLYGNDPKFTLEIATKMKELMLEDLRSNRKEEYMSLVGLAMLFDRAGGKITERMRDAIETMEVYHPLHVSLISQIRETWDMWDLNDEVQGDDMLQYDSFYNGFMAPYFSCYRCSDTKRGLQALDMDADGQVDWNEFMVYLKWALHEYPEIKSSQELLDIAFRKGLIPAMRDEIIAQEQKKQVQKSS